MKAIRVERYGDPSVLQLVDMPIPVPGSEQVLVKVYAVGVNPVETYYRYVLDPSGCSYVGN